MTRALAYRSAILLSAPGRLWWFGGLWDRLALAYLRVLGY